MHQVGMRCRLIMASDNGPLTAKSQILWLSSRNRQTNFPCWFSPISLLAVLGKPQISFIQSWWKNEKWSLKRSSLLKVVLQKRTWSEDPRQEASQMWANSALGVPACGNEPQHYSPLIIRFALQQSQLPGENCRYFWHFLFYGPAHGAARALDRY